MNGSALKTQGLLLMDRWDHTHLGVFEVDQGGDGYAERPINRLNNSDTMLGRGRELERQCNGARHCLCPGECVAIC